LRLYFLTRNGLKQAALSIASVIEKNVDGAEPLDAGVDRWLDGCEILQIQSLNEHPRVTHLG
jgi:hypothetical protein